jgi:hypothetical protein
MTAAEFKAKTGSPPQLDDLDRVNCAQAGKVGHNDCGWCEACDRPKFMCLCKHPAELAAERRRIKALKNTYHPIY